MAKYALSKWFGRGSGHVIRLHNSDLLLFRWNGSNDGYAQYLPDIDVYERKGRRLESLAALLRHVEAEHDRA